MVRVLINGFGLLAASIAFGDPAPPPLEHREQSFTIRLNGSVAEVTPFFGPVREGEWAPGWRPEFVYPARPNQVEGAVFTTKAPDGQERIWILTAYDENGGQIDYVVVTPGITANQIKIRVVALDRGKSQATITYRHTALTKQGVAEVQKLDSAWAEQQRSHWQTAINALLAKHHD